MTLRFSTLLALRQLSHKGAGLLGVFSGVCLAVVLVFVQLGFQNALINSVLNLDRVMRADLFVTGTQFETIAYTPPWFGQAVLDRAASAPGVEDVRPVWAFIGQVRDQTTGRPLAARFIAFDPARPVLTLPEVDAQLGTLALPSAILIDRRSRQGFATIYQRFRKEGMQSVYIQSTAATLAQRVDVRGAFSIGPDFSLPGNFLLSDLSYYNLFRFPLDRISLGLVTLAPGVDAVAARDRLRTSLGSSARVFTRAEFIENERRYFLDETPIGVVFFSGVIVGIVIGTAFILNMLHGIIEANLPEYAVLRALGYTDRFFLELVAQIAALISVVAFIPSILVTLCIYRLVATATKLRFELTVGLSTTVFVATLAMSLVAVLLAIRKLRSSNPLELFS